VRAQADITDVIVQATFWSGLAFVLLIGRAWPWWQHWYGRAAITIDVLLTAAFFAAVLRLTFGLRPAAWMTWLTLSALALVPARTTALAVTVIRLQVRGSNETAPADATQGQR
jgi:hypothetical protein